MNLRHVHITMLKCPQGHFSTRATIRILRNNEGCRKLSAPKHLINFIVWARLIVQLYCHFAPVRTALSAILSQHYASSLQLSLGKLKSFTFGFLAISSSCFHRLLSLAEDCFGLSDICSIGNICVGSLTARNWLSDSRSESRLIGRLETLKKGESSVWTNLTNSELSWGFETFQKINEYMGWLRKAVKIQSRQN